MRYFIICLCSFLLLAPSITLKAAVLHNGQKTVKHQKLTKKEKRLNRITKKINNWSPETKGTVSLTAGILSIVTFALGMILLLSTTTAAIFATLMILTIAFGVFALFVGRRAFKEANGGEKMGLAGMITGGIGLFLSLLLFLLVIFVLSSL